MSAKRVSPSRRSPTATAKFRDQKSTSASRSVRVRRQNGAGVLKEAPSPRSVAEHLHRAESLLARSIDYIGNDSFIGRRDTPGDATDFTRRIEDGFAQIQTNKGSGLPAHLARMCETPLLTPEQESELFRRMNFCKYRAEAIRDRLSTNNPDPASLRRAEEYLERAENVRNYLISANTRLVISIARRFADARNAFDDLLSQGLASLMHSVEKFDYDRGYRFSTYATCAVRRDLYRSVMGKKKDAQRFTTGAAEQLSACTDYRVNEDELSEKSYSILKESLAEMLQTLDERERMILVARFGLDGGRKKTSYSTLGESLGISKERVRQLANRAMDKMREIVPEYRLEALLS